MPHVVLEKTWLHPAQSASTHTCAVLDAETTVYHIHQTHFSPESIRAELEGSGFAVVEILGGLDGSPYDDTGTQIGIIAQKLPS